MLRLCDIPLDHELFLQTDMFIHCLHGCLVLQIAWILKNKQNEQTKNPKPTPVFFVFGKLTSTFACLV